MATLFDIAAAPAQVDLAGGTLDVLGISARALAVIVERFPELGQVLLGQAGASELTVEKVMSKGPDAVAALIAGVCGLAGNGEAEARAATFTFPEQAEIIAKAIKRTFPDGPGKGFARLQELMVEAGLSEIFSRKQSNSSGPTDTRTPSTTPPGSSKPGASSSTAAKREK